jgi:hypothetical protein
MMAGPHLSYFADGHNKVNLAVIFPAKIGSHIAAFKDIAESIQSELKVD